MSPNNQTDIVSLFANPAAWGDAKLHLDVLKFGAKQLESYLPKAPNTYWGLRIAGAFAKLREWKIRLALEEGSIKEWDCVGMKAAEVTTRHIRNVNSAGGIVDIIAMDEPFRSGVSACHLTPQVVAERVAAYIVTVRKKVATINPIATIGDIEAYPSTSISSLEAWINDLESAGVVPGFFHLDISLRQVRAQKNLRLRIDLQNLSDFLKSKRIPFGVIVWSGSDPVESDKSFYDESMHMLSLIVDAVGTPNQLIFQSWVTRTGTRRRDIPANLPDNNPDEFTLTKLMLDAVALYSAR